MREILVCCTFRDFDGGPNSLISEKFLQSLQQQTYKNFKLILTNYREKNVEKTIAKSGLNYEFFQSEKQDCMYSWTEFIANSFGFLGKGKHIILWAYTDLIFEPNYFEEIISNFSEGIGGTSYPQITYSNLSDFENGIATDFHRNKQISSFYQLDPNYWGPDTGWIDGDVFINHENRKVFKEHDFLDFVPVMIHTIVFSFFADRLVNLIYKSKISVIKNVRSDEKRERELSKGKNISENEASSMRAQVQNEAFLVRVELLKKFFLVRNIQKKFMWGIDPKFKLNINRQYKAIGRIDQKITYKSYILYWSLHRSIAILIRNNNTSLFVRIIRRLMKTSFALRS